MGRIMRASAIALACTVLVATVASAGPQEDAAARRRVEQGNKLYQDGRYEDALRLYLAAYDLSPDADTLFNVGLAHEKMLDFEHCALTFRRYLIEGKDPTVKERAATREARCLERAKIPVKISSSPPGAAVTLTVGAEPATFRGRTPTQLDLGLATYKVKVEMPGYIVMEQSVTLDVGARPEIDFPLEKLSTLAIDADPAGATVQLDDTPTELAPFRRELRAGKYKVRLRKLGYRDVVREIVIAPGELSTLAVTLPALPLVRELAVHAVMGAEVKIDGAPIAKSIRLPAGGYRIEAQAPHRLPFSGVVEIPGDHGTILDVRLEPHRSTTQRVALWTMTGVAVTLVIAGSVYGIMALDAQREYDRIPSVTVADRGDAYAQRSDVLVGIAVTGALATGVLWWLTRPQQSSVEVR